MLVRLAGLEPLAMTALSCCAHPVTDTAKCRAGEDEGHGGVTDGNGENRPNDQCNCRDADVDGVLGVCHTCKGSRVGGPGLCETLLNMRSFKSGDWGYDDEDWPDFALHRKDK